MSASSKTVKYSASIDSRGQNWGDFAWAIFFKRTDILYSDNILALWHVRLSCPDCWHNMQRLPPLPLWTSSKPDGALCVDAVSLVRRLAEPAGRPHVLSCRRGPCSGFERLYNSSCKFL